MFVQNLERAQRAMEDFLAALDVDVEALGMEKTPERVARMFGFLFDGLGRDTKEIWGETYASGSDGLVAVRRIPFYSICEHHLVPFFGEVSLVYLPQEGRVAGFSKFTELVRCLAHRPQLQERLTRQIAEAIAEDLGARGVLVSLSAQQLCMMMRGELAHGARTMTTYQTGLFREEEALLAQAYHLIGGENA